MSTQHESATTTDSQRDQLAAAIQAYAHEHETIPTRTRFLDDHDYTGPDIQAKYGGWDAALQAAGLPTTPHNASEQLRACIYAAELQGGDG